MVAMTASYELRTDRLVVRALESRDVDEFVRYRNVDDIARFQDWPVPYTFEMAHQLVAEVAQLGGPTRGHWIQLAIEHDGIIVGDIAVWIDNEGLLASIGYTIAPEHQGHNYAVEAAAEMVEWLFGVAGVHRITATLDPRNIASARVLERTGFEYNGTARAAAWVRGRWEDDTRYSLLADDWEQWKSRPTSPPHRVEFVEVTAENIREVGNIEVALSQRRFVSSVNQSIADAAHPPRTPTGAAVDPWYRAIVADDVLVGFVMVAMPAPGQPIPILWRLLVDTWHQRRGIARRTVAQLAERLVADGCSHLDVSFVDEPGGPESFYVPLGFERTGIVDDDGEVRARALLADLVRHAGRR